MTSRFALALMGIAMFGTPLPAQSGDVRRPQPFVTGVITHLWTLGDSRGMTGMLGLGLASGRFRLHAQAIDIGALKQGDEDQYQWTFSRGTRYCEHVPTGDYVDDDHCFGPWTIASAVELLYAFGTDLPLMIGAGYRFGDNTTPFGTLAVALSPLSESHVLARLSVGEDYVQVGLGVAWARER